MVLVPFPKLILKLSSQGILDIPYNLCLLSWQWTIFPYFSSHSFLSHSPSPSLIILTPHLFIFPLIQQAHKKKTNSLCGRTQEEVVAKAERSLTARSHKELDQLKQGIHPSLITSSSSPSNSSSTTDNSCTTTDP